MKWYNKYLCMDFAFVVFFAAITLFSFVVVILGLAGIKTTW